MTDVREPSSTTQPIPESILKKRKRDTQWAAQKAAAAAEAKKAQEAKRDEIFKRAEKYVKEYRDQVRVRCERGGGDAKEKEARSGLGSVGSRRRRRARTALVNDELDLLGVLRAVR